VLKSIGAIILGSGIAIIFFILDRQLVNIPLFIAICIYIIGGLFILFGGWYLFRPKQQPEPILHITISDYEFWLQKEDGSLHRDSGAYDYKKFGIGELFLRIYSNIDVYPKVFIHNMELRIGGLKIPVKDWNSKQMEGSYHRELDFAIPQNVTSGECEIQVIGNTDKGNWRSNPYIVKLPYWTSP